MKVINIGLLKCKLLECRISSIEEKLDKLQDLSLFYQSRFNNDRSDKIKNKIEYLRKREMELVVVFNKTRDDFLRNPGLFPYILSLMKRRGMVGEM
jgi:hypothetical protein